MLIDLDSRIHVASFRADFHGDFEHCIAEGGKSNSLLRANNPRATAENAIMVMEAVEESTNACGFKDMVDTVITDGSTAFTLKQVRDIENLEKTIKNKSLSDLFHILCSTYEKVETVEITNLEFNQIKNDLEHYQAILRYAKLQNIKLPEYVQLPSPTTQSELVAQDDE